jgi:hypothetical protein
MEIFVYNSGNSGHAMISVETPIINDTYMPNSIWNAHKVDIIANLDY